MPKPSICLNMIVKNEAHVIRRCLESARPLIDCWVIVDTGSTDGTQNLIRETLKDFPGRLLEKPWRGFGPSRTEAIDAAKGWADYLLLIDADDFFVAPSDFEWPALSDDSYEITIHYGEFIYRRTCLIRTSLPWRYVGVLHEVLDCETARAGGFLNGFHMRIAGGGSRSQVDGRTKFTRDAEVLETALKEEPNNARYQFYLAQSWRDAGELEKALDAYERRAVMGGWREEVFCSLLQCARISRRLNKSFDEVLNRYLRAHEARPERAEALGDLAMYCRENGPRWALAQMFADRARQIPLPADRLFLETAWYHWRCCDEYAVACSWLGEHEQACATFEKLLTSPDLPNDQRSRVLANLNHSRRSLGLGPQAEPA